MTIYLPKGKKTSHEFRTEQEYVAFCNELVKQHGTPLFEMAWPNKKIFIVFRDRQDNEIEVQYRPITIGEFQ